MRDAPRWRVGVKRGFDQGGRTPGLAVGRVSADSVMNDRWVVYLSLAAVLFPPISFTEMYQTAKQTTGLKQNIRTTATR